MAHAVEEPTHCRGRLLKDPDTTLVADGEEDVPGSGVDLGAVVHLLLVLGREAGDALHVLRSSKRLRPPPAKFEPGELLAGRGEAGQPDQATPRQASQHVEGVIVQDVVRGVELDVEGCESVQVELLGRHRQRAVDACEEVQEGFGASGRQGHPGVRTCHRCRWRRLYLRIWARPWLPLGEGIRAPSSAVGGVLLGRHPLMAQTWRYLHLGEVHAPVWKRRQICLPWKVSTQLAAVELAPPLGELDPPFLDLPLPSPLPFPLVRGPGESSWRVRLVPRGSGGAGRGCSQLEEAWDIVADGRELVEGVVQGPLLDQELADGLPKFAIRGQELLGGHCPKTAGRGGEGIVCYPGVVELQVCQVRRPTHCQGVTEDRLAAVKPARRERLVVQVDLRRVVHEGVSEQLHLASPRPLSLCLMDLLVLLDTEAILPGDPTQETLESLVHQTEEADRGCSVLRQNLPRLVLLEPVDEGVNLVLGELWGDVLHPAHLLRSGRRPPGGLLRLGHSGVSSRRMCAPRSAMRRRAAGWLKRMDSASKFPSC